MGSSDPARPDDSWRRVGLRLTGFFLPLVLALAALEWWAAGVPNAYSLKRQRLESLANEVDTLILGSSSAFCGIQPGLLSGSSFNLASVNETLYEEEGVVMRALPWLPKLKRVIIQIHYTTFFGRRAGSEEIWRQFCYEQEWHIPPEQMKYRLDCCMWSRLALRTPRYYLHLLAGSVRGLVRKGKFVCDPPEVNDMDNRGWWRPVQQDSFPLDLSPAAAKYTLTRLHKVMKVENEPDNVAFMDHLLSMFRQRNIDVVFVTTPVWPAFQSGMEPDSWNETQRLVAQRTNNDGVHYYSFLTVPQLEPQDFYDPDHLNARGASQFTKLLNAELNQGKPGSFTGRR